MNNWYIVIYKSLIIVTVISLIIYNLTFGQQSLGALISGLVVLSFSIIMILFTILYNILKTTENASFLQSAFAILNGAGPFFVMLGVTIFILYLIISNSEKIIAGHISDSYYTFSNIAVFIILLQSYFVYTNVNTPKFEATKKLSKITNILLYLFSVIIGISAGTLFAILKYYSTDG
jgi:hypothetical protein